MDMMGPQMLNITSQKTLFCFPNKRVQRKSRPFPFPFVSLLAGPLLDAACLSGPVCGINKKREKLFISIKQSHFCFTSQKFCSKSWNSSKQPYTVGIRYCDYHLVTNIWYCDYFATSIRYPDRTICITLWQILDSVTILTRSQGSYNIRYLLYTPTV